MTKDYFEIWNLDAGCWVLGVGCWVLGVGCWVLGVGCWVLGVGCWKLKYIHYSLLTTCLPTGRLTTHCR